MLLGGVSMNAIPVWGAANGVYAVPADHGPQIMLHVSKPLGSDGSSLRLFGLRIESSRASPASPQPSAMVPIQHRALIDLQIRGHSDVQVQFGRRLVWNLARGTVGAPFSPAGQTIGVPIRGTKLPELENRHPGDPGYAGISAFTGSPVAVVHASIFPRETPAAERWGGNVPLPIAPHGLNAAE